MFILRNLYNGTTGVRYSQIGKIDMRSAILMTRIGLTLPYTRAGLIARGIIKESNKWDGMYDE